MTLDLNQLAQRVHQANIKWWQDIETGQLIHRNRGELLMLTITEIAEACEGERKDLMDDKIPHRRMAEVEMADAFIRLLDFAAGFKYYITVHPLEEQIDNKGENLLWICAAVTKVYTMLDVGFPIARILSYCKHYNYDLMGAFEDKMAYNATREDHKHEARKLADGKKW